MDLDFLKLDWRKIFLVYIILLFPEIIFFLYWFSNLYVFVPFLLFSIFFLVILVPKFEKSEKAVLILAFFYVYLAFLFKSSFFGFVMISWSIEGVLGLRPGILVYVARTVFFAVYYVISSSIIWIYDEMKKKK